MNSLAHQDIRKIIRMGNTSFGVIIPRAWLRFFELDQTDSVEVISNTDIIIRPIKNIPKARRRGSS